MSDPHLESLARELRAAGYTVEAPRKPVEFWRTPDVPCTTVVKQINGLPTVTCERHPEFKVPMRQGVSTDAADEIGRFHREGWDRGEPEQPG